MKTEVLIIGGGIAGLTLAALLGGAGLEVCLVDAAPPAPDKTPPLSARTVALMQTSLNVLRQAGIGDSDAAFGTPLKTMRIIDDSAAGAAPVTLSFDAEEIGMEAFGTNIPNDVLRTALLNRLKTMGTVTLCCPGRLQSYSAQGQTVTATLEDGRIVTAALIVGMDGAQSRVRQIAGIEASSHDYGQTAMTCLIDHSRPHGFTSTEFHRPGGPFTLVPMPGNRCSVVWVEKADDAKNFLALRRQDFEKALQERSRDLVGRIALASNPESWPLKKLSARRLTAPRVALAAEAAHVLSPIGAQGLNLSLRDVAVLAETLADAARRGEDIGGPLVLDAYAGRRRPDIVTRAGGIDAMNRIVSNNVVFLRGLRRTGLRALDAIPPLRSLAMHQGLAPAMDEGRLLRGHAL